VARGVRNQVAGPPLPGRGTLGGGGGVLAPPALPPPPAAAAAAAVRRRAMRGSVARMKLSVWEGTGMREESGRSGRPAFFRRHQNSPDVQVAHVDGIAKLVGQHKVAEGGQGGDVLLWMWVRARREMEMEREERRSKGAWSDGKKKRGAGVCLFSHTFSTRGHTPERSSTSMMRRGVLGVGGAMLARRSQLSLSLSLEKREMKRTK